MKKYIAVLEIEDNEEIVHAEVTYFYSNNGITYKATEKMELKEESEDTKNKTYEDGLNEAWEAARKMYQFNPINNKQLCEELYDMGFNEFICSTTASEAIKQIKEYKEKQEEIKVGDEVVDKYGWKRVVTKTHNSREITIMDCNGQFYECCKKAVESDFKKTGRNFPQIEEVLKQMKEDEDE